MVINVDPSWACIPALRAMWRLMREAPTATAYKEAKAQSRLMRRAARVLHKADCSQEHAVTQALRHAAHDVGRAPRGSLTE